MNKKHGLVSALAVAMVLAGCASAPTYSPSNSNGSQSLSKHTSHTPKSAHKTSAQMAAPSQNHSHNAFGVIDGQVGSAAHFNQWLANSAQQSDVAKYQQYLAQQLGVAAVPPMHELLTTARSWLVCGFAPYQVPPETLWSSMLPTLRLYHALKTQAVLPAHTQIRSVYRNPALNECAGGAPSSKHMANSAIDVWIPDYAPDDPRLAATQDALCQFWLVHGERWNLGLGLYATGAIHLDTQGYRKWGAQHSLGGAACQQMFAGQ